MRCSQSTKSGDLGEPMSPGELEALSRTKHQILDAGASGCPVGELSERWLAFLQEEDAVRVEGGRARWYVFAM